MTPSYGDLAGRLEEAADDYGARNSIDHGDDLRQAAQALRGMGWQDIATAPKDGTLILLRYHFGSENGIVSQARWSKTSRGWFTPGQHATRATHWMPLPEPPRSALKDRKGD